MRIPEDRTENRSPRTLLARVVVTPTRSTSSCLPSPPPSPAFASSPRPRSRRRPSPPRRARPWTSRRCVANSHARRIRALDRRSRATRGSIRRRERAGRARVVARLRARVRDRRSELEHFERFFARHRVAHRPRARARDAVMGRLRKMGTRPKSSGRNIARCACVGTRIRIRMTWKRRR